MLKGLKEFVKTNNLFCADDKILAAVSGGIDSVTMLDLLYKCGLKIGIAHCNFQLRGNESDEDQNFVAKLAEQYRLPYFTINFDTKTYSGQNGISIEMAARDLRYKWFEGIRGTNGYDYIAVAHNQDDSIETFLLNIIRGTGIRGLCGIKARNEKIVRPLLFANRQQIEEYISINALSYRVDSTNNDISIKRNKLRHTIIPELETLNPSFKRTTLENIERFREIEEIYISTIEQNREELLNNQGKYTTLNIKELKKLQPLRTYLFEFLSPFGFNNDTVADIIASIDTIPGKQFFSSTHRIVKDRENLIISKIGKSENPEFQINVECKAVTEPLILEINRFIKDENYKLSTDPLVAHLDIESLQFPLKLRKWQDGDYFYPLGMTNRKKISDFFNDNKYSLCDKENTWLLTSGNKIVWIVGKRIDNRFKINSKTKIILELRLKSSWYIF